MESKIINILFSALRASLMGQPLDRELYRDLSEKEWTKLFKISAQQGVCAIVYDVISQLPKEMQPPKGLHIHWTLSAENIETRYNLQKKLANELAELYADNGVKTVVLKGFGISSYYPIPSYRECGDFDCFLCGDFEKGNEIASQNGAHVEPNCYKHSHIHYKGLMVENHQFCIGIRGSEKVKGLERHLESLIFNDTNPRYFEDTKLVIPNADFNAIFLINHSFGHFISNGIKLRPIYDWILLLKKEQESIDWKTFYEICDGLHLTRFVNIINYISVTHLGLKLTNPQIGIEKKYSDKVLKDIFVGGNALYTGKHKSAWHMRLALVKNRFSYIWKYHKIYRKSLTIELLKSTLGVLLNPHPKL